ncbi:DsrE family protein [Thermopirellula anaerolimosa]
MQTRLLLWLSGVIALTACCTAFLARGTEPTADTASNASRLAVLWSSGDPDVAHRVCLMYTHAAATNHWFGEVRLIVWGPSARLLAGDKDLQAKVQAMMKDGVEVQACIVCADSYGVADTLRGLGIEVKPMGRPLTDMLQGGYHVLTF